MTLTADNFKKGMLVDEELMAGISVTQTQEYQAYVLRHTTGEYLGNQVFKTLPEALQALQSIPRDWKFEQTSGCGEGKCRKVGGDCAGDKCTTCACV